MSSIVILVLVLGYTNANLEAEAYWLHSCWSSFDATLEINFEKLYVYFSTQQLSPTPQFLFFI